jgi:hypothetical protein
MGNDTRPESDAFQNMFSAAGGDDPLAVFDAEAPSADANGAPPSPVRQD